MIDNDRLLLSGALSKENKQQSQDQGPISAIGHLGAVETSSFHAPIPDKDRPFIWDPNKDPTKRSTTFKQGF